MLDQLLNLEPGNEVKSTGSYLTGNESLSEWKQMPIDIVVHVLQGLVKRRE
jgi:hypothetical protein